MTDIYHSGIKGQRKGIRRFQYMNGTYTKAGNERYRPSSGARAARNVIVGSMLGQMALVAAKNAQASTKKMTVDSAIEAVKNLVITANANKVAIGKAVTNAILSIPAPVRAMALPVIAIGVGALVANGAMHSEEILERVRDIPWQKVAKKTVSIGASSAGVVLSSISGNPIPAVAGMSISALMALNEGD